MTRRTRTFADTSDADVFSRIANDHGLTADVDVTGPTHKVLAQVNQSDLAFLRERARALDAEVWVDGSTLFVKSHASRNGGDAQADLRAEPAASSRSSPTSRTSARASRSAAGTSRARTGLKYEATDSVVSGELNGATSGASILQQAFGARKESLAHTVPLSAQEAQAEAESFFKLMARRFVVGRGVAETHARLRVGGYVELDGLGRSSAASTTSPRSDTSSTARGLRTEFTVERPGIGKV